MDVNWNPPEAWTRQSPVLVFPGAATGLDALTDAREVGLLPDNEMVSTVVKDYFRKLYRGEMESVPSRYYYAFQQEFGEVCEELGE